MPYGKPEPQDPQVLVGVSVNAEPSSVREMAVAFAGEFARMGVDADRLLALFRSPFYAGAHAAWRALGDAEIRRIVGEHVAFWSRVRVRVEERTAGARINARLPGRARAQ